jgi:hypothetical protein
VEVLVALAITTLAVSVLTAALYNLAKVQDTLSGALARQEREQQAIDAWRNAVQQALTYELPLHFTVQQAQARRFAGSESGFSFESTASLAPALPAAGLRLEFQLRAEPLADTPQVQLLYAEPGVASTALASFAARSARFGYLDRRGRVYPAWPVSQAPNEPTPLAVQLVFETEAGRRTHLAAAHADSWVLPSNRGLFDIQGLGQ